MRESILNWVVWGALAGALLATTITGNPWPEAFAAPFVWLWMLLLTFIMICLGLLGLIVREAPARLTPAMLEFASVATGLMEKSWLSKILYLVRMSTLIVLLVRVGAPFTAFWMLSTIGCYWMLATQVRRQLTPYKRGA